MPRRPTGQPRGRPKGSGILGPQTRLTVRIPTDLYDRLEAFATGRHFHRGDPQLAGCVREALEHYLACPHKRQIINIPHSRQALSDDNWQTQKSTEARSTVREAPGDDKRQTIIVPALPVPPVEPQGETISLPRNEQAESQAVSEEVRAKAVDDKRQTENVPPARGTTEEEARGKSRQTINLHTIDEEYNRQTEKSAEAEAERQEKKGENIRQTKKERGPRSDIPNRIMALLHEHPEGLRAEELRVYLKAPKPLGDTLQGMERTGKLKSAGSRKDKKYFVPEGRVLHDGIV